MDLKKEISESNGELNDESVRDTVGIASSLSPMDNSATTSPNGSNRVHEFEIPNSLVGLIIGVRGKVAKELGSRTGAFMQLRKHDDAAKVDSHQICQVSGTDEQINNYLLMLSERLPLKRCPELNLQPVLPPALLPILNDVDMETEVSESNGELNEVACLEQKMERMRAENLMNRKNMVMAFDAVYLMQDKEQCKLDEEVAALRKAVYGDDVDKPIVAKEEEEEDNGNEEVAIDESLQHLMESLRSEKHKKELEQISNDFKAVLALKKRKVEQQREKVEVTAEDEKNTYDGRDVQALNEVTDASVYFKFVNISELTSEPVYHKPAVLNGVEWLVSLHKNGEFLACTVAGKAIKGNSFPNATVEFDLNSAEDYSNDHHKTLQKRVHQGTHFYENLHFIPIEDLFENKKELVTDDTVTVGVHIDFSPSEN